MITLKGKTDMKLPTSLAAKVAATAVVGGLVTFGGLAAANASPAACPANAACQTITASVGQNISLTGLADFSFGQFTPGTPDTVPNAENEVVTTNADNGYTLYVTPETGTFNGPTVNDSPATFPNSDVSVALTSPTLTGLSGWTFSGTAQQMVDQEGTPTPANGNQYHEAWTLNEPTEIPAGQYTASFDYVAQVNVA
jgi:hypothetical protein